MPTTELDIEQMAEAAYDEFYKGQKRPDVHDGIGGQGSPWIWRTAKPGVRRRWIRAVRAALVEGGR